VYIFTWRRGYIKDYAKTDGRRGKLQFRIQTRLDETTIRGPTPYVAKRKTEATTEACWYKDLKGRYSEQEVEEYGCRIRYYEESMNGRK
jgi:hypothetical protein